MKTMRWNGEYWYEDRRSLFKRVRSWFIWVGGWEKPHGNRIRDPRWAIRRDDGTVRGPTPITLFWHRLTVFNQWVSFRTRWGYVNWNFRNGTFYNPIQKGYAYISRDGTPSSAHHWLWGWRAEHLKRNPDRKGLEEAA
jgi:hypothetical protein